MKKLLALLAVFAVAGTAGAELLTDNRAFETGDTTDWLQWGSGSGDATGGWNSSQDTWGVITDGTAFEGESFLNQTQDNNWWGYTLAWQGEATPIVVGENTPLLLSGYVRTADADAFLKVEAFGGGANLGADLEINFGGSIVKDGSTWNYIEMSYMTPVGTDSVRAAVGANNGVFSLDADAMSLTVVPEPATMVLLSLGLVGLLLRRRT